MAILAGVLKICWKLEAKEALPESNLTQTSAPSGAKAPSVYGPFTAGLKPRPFKAVLVQRFPKGVLALRVEAAGRTDIGLVRRSNQDSFGVDERLGLYLVCDGMGGAAGGEVASALAVETFLEIARQELGCVSCDPMELTARSLRRAVKAANRAVIERAAWDMRLRGMGSTLVGARVSGGSATVINVGDSRAYLVRGGVARQITEDHSYVAEQVKLGLMAESQVAESPMRSVITRAIGADVDVIPDEYEVLLEPGDVLLLSSDGLTRHVEAEEIGELVSGAEDVDAACLALIALAKERGGSDNVTCVAVKSRG